MKGLILVLFTILSTSVYAQTYNLDTARAAHSGSKAGDDIIPNKGSKYIICAYEISGDSLFKKIAKDLIAYGYTVDKKDNELLFITTSDKPIKHLTYTMKAVIQNNEIKLTSLWKSSVGFQIGYVKTEQSPEEVKYTSKLYETRHIFEDMIKYAQSTHPLSIRFEK